MAAPVDRFYTPEQSFEGLNRLSDKLERRQYRADQMAQREEARRASTGKFLADYLDSKDYLTGTYYDPQIVSGFQDLLAEGAALANKGADPNMLMMALAPKVNKLSQYSTKAKLLNENLKRQMVLIKPNTGYDIPKLEQEARRAAFFDAKGELKDINTVDPEMDWVSETIKMFPEKVTTDAGIDEFVKNSPKFVNTKDVTRYTPRGGMERSKVKVTAPNWLTPDIDEKGAMTGLAPKFQIAIDNGQPVMHEFITPTGEKKIAPVRLLDEAEFNSILSSNPGIADWVKGQVRLANPDVDLNSPQAKNTARAILYDELKRRMPGGIEDIEVSKPAQIRVSTGGGSGSAKNAAADWVRRATAAIGTTDIQKIKDEFSQLYQGDKNLYEDVDFTGDKITVKFKPGKQSDLSMIASLLSGKGVEEGGIQTVELDVKDPYLSQKLARVYQQIMGGDVNVERSQYPTKKTQPTTGGGKTETLAEKMRRNKK